MSRVSLVRIDNPSPQSLFSEDPINRFFRDSNLVGVALFYWTDIEESLCKVPGLHRERAKGDAPTIRDVTVRRFESRKNLHVIFAHYFAFASKISGLFPDMKKYRLLLLFCGDDLLVGMIFVLLFGIRGADLGNWALFLKGESLYLATLSTPQVRCYFRLLLAPSWFHSASFAQKFFWIKGVDNQKGGLIVLKNHESRIFYTNNVKIKSGLAFFKALWQWIAQNSQKVYFHGRGVPRKGGSTFSHKPLLCTVSAASCQGAIILTRDVGQLFLFALHIKVFLCFLCTLIYVREHALKPTCTHIHTQTHTYSHTHTYTHTDTHTHTHAYTGTLVHTNPCSSF